MRSARCGHETDLGQPCPACGPAAALAERPRRGGRRITLTAAALVLAAAAAGTVLTFARESPPPPAAGGQRASERPAQDPRAPGGTRAAAAGSGGTAGRPASGVAAAAASHRAGGLPPGGGTALAVAPAAAGQPRTPAVLGFLGRYFSAIDRHDYRAYLGLFSPASRQALSAAQFLAGYGTTRDSAAALVRLRRLRARAPAAAPGELAATVTFSSRQAPSAAAPGASCLRWRITLYLIRRGRRLVIAAPPPWYAAADRACRG